MLSVPSLVYFIPRTKSVLIIHINIGPYKYNTPQRIFPCNLPSRYTIGHHSGLDRTCLYITSLIYFSSEIKFCPVKGNSLLLLLQTLFKVIGRTGKLGSLWHSIHTCNSLLDFLKKIFLSHFLLAPSK